MSCPTLAASQPKNVDGRICIPVEFTATLTGVPAFIQGFLPNGAT